MSVWQVGVDPVNCFMCLFLCYILLQLNRFFKRYIKYEVHNKKYRFKDLKLFLNKFAHFCANIEKFKFLKVLIYLLKCQICYPVKSIFTERFNIYPSIYVL